MTGENFDEWTDRDRLEVTLKILNDESHDDIGRVFGVSKFTISDIRKRLWYKKLKSQILDAGREKILCDMVRR